MDFVAALGGIGAAFGLASSAGLNAYIPLLIVALVARFTSLIQLSEPYNLLTNSWVIAVLALLMIIEMLVDKVPAVDSVNDVIQTFIRPSAGAILFAANADVITDINPLVAILAGILLAGGVHTVKSVARPAVTATTVGTGNWVVSIVEDVVATIISILSILLPALTLFVTLFLIVMGGRYVYRRRRRRRQQVPSEI
jgi:nicotinamide riboside transporter PnuC